MRPAIAAKASFLLLCLALIAVPHAQTETPALSGDPMSPALASLREIDKAVDARIMALNAEQASAFEAKAADCQRPNQGPDWLAYRLCIVDALPRSSLSLAEAFENWASRLQALSDELDRRAELLDDKDRLLDEFGVILKAVNAQAESSVQDAGQNPVEDTDPAVGDDAKTQPAQGAEVKTNPSGDPSPTGATEEAKK